MMDAGADFALFPIPPLVTQEMKKNLLDMIGDDVDGSKAISLGARGGTGNAGVPGNKVGSDSAGLTHLGQMQQRDHVVRGASGVIGAAGNMSQMAGNGGGPSAAMSHFNTGANSNNGLSTSASSMSTNGNAPSFPPSMPMMNPQNPAQVLRMSESDVYWDSLFMFMAHLEPPLLADAAESPVCCCLCALHIRRELI